MQEQPEFVSLPVAATVFGIGLTRLRGFVKSGALQAFTQPDGRKLLVRPDDVRNLLVPVRQQPPEPEPTTETPVDLVPW